VILKQANQKNFFPVSGEKIRTASRRPFLLRTRRHRAVFAGSRYRGNFDRHIFTVPFCPLIRAV
jgi:hypothetical protein